MISQTSFLLSDGKSSYDLWTCELTIYWNMSVNQVCKLYFNNC